MRSLALGVFVVLAVVGCGDDEADPPGGATGTGASGGSSSASSSSSTTGGNGGAGAAGGSGATGGVGGTGAGGVPACPVDAGGVVLAVSDLYLGETDFNGVKDINAWKTFGFDIDGKLSTETSTDLCQPMSGGKKTVVYPDGADGIDNSFGKNMVNKILGALIPDVSAEATQAIHDGGSTLLFAFDGLAAQTDEPAFTTRIYAGAPLGAPALFDGSDCWSVVPELLDDPQDIESSNMTFPTSSLEANVWSSNGLGTVTLSLATGALPLRLVIHQARMRATLDPDHAGATLGHIGGVLDTQELVAEFVKTAGNLDPSLCSGNTVANITNQIEQYSDILVDGTQDPAQTCNGISIGIGFKLQRAGLDGVAPATPPAPDPCNP